MHPEAPATLTLNLHVTDAEVIAELITHEDGTPRTRFALDALRLGVMSLKYASGQLDSAAIKAAGNDLITQLNGLLLTQSKDLNDKISTELTRYFDPSTGSLTQRIQNLVQQDGDLDKLLRTHIDGDNSTLAQSLAQHVGKNSPLFKMLSPDEKDSVSKQLEVTIKNVLDQQTKTMLDEFSLNNKQSALSRLIGELKTIHTEVSDGVKKQIDSLVNQFTLDNADSALARMKKQLSDMLVESKDAQQKFFVDVNAALAAGAARKEEALKSTRHGLAFEEQLGVLLSQEAQRYNDIFESVGNTVGAIERCKVGDHVVVLGAESSTPGVRLVWEAKEQQGYDVPRALAEIDTARKNRQAQVGIFVFSSKVAPPALEPCVRYGHDIIVVWDAEDPTTDIFVRAAYSIARSIAVLDSTASGEVEQAVKQIELSARAIKKQIAQLEKFETMGSTIKSHGQKIMEGAEEIRRELEAQVSGLEATLGQLRGG